MAPTKIKAPENSLPKNNSPVKKKERIERNKIIDKPGHHRLEERLENIVVLEDYVAQREDLDMGLDQIEDWETGLLGTYRNIRKRIPGKQRKDSLKRKERKKHGNYSKNTRNTWKKIKEAVNLERKTEMQEIKRKKYSRLTERSKKYYKNKVKE